MERAIACLQTACTCVTPPQEADNCYSALQDSGGSRRVLGVP